MDRETVIGIIRQYTQHGWVLRRLVLTDELRNRLGADFVDDLGVAARAAKLDAAWFSRPPTGGAVAWEVRYLGSFPFALVETIDESEPDFESRLQQVEDRLNAVVAKKRTA
jgi:hypothetical protein